MNIISTILILFQKHTIYYDSINRGKFHLRILRWIVCMLDWKQIPTTLVMRLTDVNLLWFHPSLREEHRLRMFKSRVPRRTFLSKGGCNRRNILTCTLNQMRHGMRESCPGFLCCRYVLIPPLKTSDMTFWKMIVANQYLSQENFDKYRVSGWKVSKIK
jgi:hypothetical protein